MNHGPGISQPPCHMSVQLSHLACAWSTLQCFKLYQKTKTMAIQQHKITKKDNLLGDILNFHGEAPLFFKATTKFRPSPGLGLGGGTALMPDLRTGTGGGAKSSNIGNGKCLTYINISKNGKSILKSMVKKWKKGCSYFGWNHKNKAENWEQQPSRLISGPYCRWWKGRKTSLDSITD